jgi:hypothetical protein
MRFLFPSPYQDLPEISSKQMVQTEKELQKGAWTLPPTFSSTSSKFKAAASFSHYIFFFWKNQRPDFSLSSNLTSMQMISSTYGPIAYTQESTVYINQDSTPAPGQGHMFYSS